MKSMKMLAVLFFSLIFTMSFVLIAFADQTTMIPVSQTPPGPVVEEYKVYVDDNQRITPGSLSGDVNLSTVGKGLFFDGQDFYFFVDTGVMASNYMFNIEGDRFFFGEDGKMVKNQLINYDDEIYYFDVNGAMYKNRWYTQEEIDTYDNTIEYTDYYFGPTGRAYRANDGGNCEIVVKTIDGEKYGFNTDGEKVEGYYDEDGMKRDPDDDPAFANCVYYFDPEENGAATVGWHYYEGATRLDEYDTDDEIVLYFDEKTCRKVAAKKSDSYPDRCISRIIEGQRYMFDSNGVRRNKWYKSETGGASNPQRGVNSNVKYFNDEYDGYLQKGWFLAVPGLENDRYNEGNKFGLRLDVNVQRHKDDEEMWFYAGSNGNILRKTIRKIGNYVYAFDDDGVMQQDALVRVRNGEFIKAYQTENLYKANVLFDPNDTDGNADPDPNGVSNPINLDPKKGILNVRDKEQWMYFMGDITAEDKVGAMAKTNVPVKIELNDEDIYFLCNSTGGYTTKNPNTGLTDVVNRNKKLIQNGVLLKPNPDNNNYGVVRTSTEKVPLLKGSIQNWCGEVINPDSDDYEAYRYVVVKASGEAVPTSSQFTSFKDKNGNYIYVGKDGHFLGVYPYEGKCHVNPAKSDLPSAEDPIIKAGTSYYWTYKDTDKTVRYGLPPEEERMDSSYLWLNFGDAGTTIEGGPYENGFAQFIYTDVD